MADTKKPSLTVLGGPMAGTRFVFEEGPQHISVGSDEGCSFRLQLPGVSPKHARLVIEAGGVTIYAAGSEAGLHVNDNRVDQSGTTLRNGDIVWLGTPGDVDVVMLQCILPRVTAQPAAAPPRPAPEPPPEPAVVDENATVSLGPETFFEAETVVQPPPAAPEPAIHLTQEFTPAEEPRPGAEPPVTFSLDDQATQLLPPPSPPHAEEETSQTVAEPPPFVVTDESSTVVLDAVEFSGEVSEPTAAIPPAPEATRAMPPPAPEPRVLVPPPAPPKPAPSAAAAPPARARVPPRAAPAARPPAVARPAAPPPAAPSPRARPQPAERSTPPPPRAAAGKSSSAGRYAGIGVVVLLLVGGGGYAAWRFLLNEPTTPPAQRTPPAATPAPVRTPRAVEPPVVATRAPVPVESLAPTPPPAVPTPSPKASAAPTPSPSPSPRKETPTPPPVKAPTAPSAEAQRAAQVANLVGQAEAALAARQYDQAIGHFDELLRLEPQNGQATNGRASAIALRDAARKRFVPGRTVVKTEKASGGLAGFDSGDVAVQKAPDFSGRIEFEMAPPAGIRPGDAYTLRFFLVNEGKKAIRIQGVTVNTSVNGAGAGAQVPPATKEVAPQQRAQIGEISGSWKDGTTSWLAEVLITANKGDSLKSQITWR